MQLNDLRDEELIFFINLRSGTALDEMNSRYKNKASFLVNEVTGQFPNSGVSKDCLINVCLNSLPKSIANFRKEKMSLYSYWKTTALHDVAEYLKQNSYTVKNNQFIGLSLDAYVQLENDTVCLCDSLGSEDEDSEDDLYNAIVRTINEDSFQLKQEEKNLFLCYIKGFEVEEIQQAFPQFSKSKIYRAIRMGKELLAKQIRE